MAEPKHLVQVDPDEYWDAKRWSVWRRETLKDYVSRAVRAENERNQSAHHEENKTHDPTQRIGD